MKRKSAVSVIAIATSLMMLTSGCTQFVSHDVASLDLAPLPSKQDILNYYKTAMQYKNSAVTDKEPEQYETYEKYDVKGDKRDELINLTKQAQEIISRDAYDSPTEEEANIVPVDNYNYIKATIDDLALSNGEITAVQEAIGYYFVDVKYSIAPQEQGKFDQYTPYIGVDGAILMNYDGSYTINNKYLSAAANKMNEYYYDNMIFKRATFNQENGTFVVEDVDTLMEIKQAPVTDTVQYIDQSGEEYITKDGVVHTNETETAQKNEEQTDVNEDDATGENEDAANNDEEAADSNINNTRRSNLKDVATTEENAGNETEEQNLNSSDTNDTNEETKESDDKSTEENTKANEDTEDTENTENTENTEAGELVDANGQPIQPETYQYRNYVLMPSDDRQASFDMSSINTIVGVSKLQRANCPDLDLVYIKPQKSGEVAGYGIYPSGNFGMTLFGFDRSKVSGDATLRYVFKDTIDSKTGESNITGVNIYLLSENINTGITEVDNNVMVPEFVHTELEKIVDRFDRCEANSDLSGLLNNNVVTDMGHAVLRGYKEKSTNVLKSSSTIKDIVTRDIDNGAYLLSVMTTYRDGSKFVDTYGTYNDHYYMVVQQIDDKFVITDLIRDQRRVSEEPGIKENDATELRMYALNFSGEIADADKQDIKIMMDDWYKAGTMRLFYSDASRERLENGEEYIEYDNPLVGKVQTSRDFFDLLDSDVTMLKTEDLNKIITTLFGELDRYGKEETTAVWYDGLVTQWISGTNNQAEFTTEEVIEYEGRDDVYYMQCYYLVSKMKDTWVIDERKVISGAEYTGTEAEDVAARIHAH